MDFAARCICMDLARSHPIKSAASMMEERFKTSDNIRLRIQDKKECEKKKNQSVQQSANVENYFDYSARVTWRKILVYFVFNIVDYGLLRSGARRRALAQTICNARGLDINSP
jgi:hypothetical protein